MNVNYQKVGGKRELAVQPLAIRRTERHVHSARPFCLCLPSGVALILEWPFSSHSLISLDKSPLSKSHMNGLGTNPMSF